MTDLMLRDPLRLFDQVWGADPFQMLETATRRSTYHVTSTETGYEVELEVPGFTKETLDVSVEAENILTVKGERKARDGRTVRVQRQFTLPDDADPATIQAKIEHGLLMIAIQRHAKALPKKVAIEG
ncbi:MAG TPA: Hsp20/alpha crystallin family protein [Candidatus Dormibacteraeota bacterium]|nr:Hsp20/alpha crystallin family protein [Candidatus Dormibacteraeota bacterium]